jgi:hypothetical protein
MNRTEEVLYHPLIKVNGEWTWPLYGMLTPHTLDDAVAMFDALDVAPWRDAERMVLKTTRSEEVVWP